MCRIFTILTALCLTVTALQAQVLFSADFEGDNANVSFDGGWVINGSNASQYFPIPAHSTYASVNDDGLGATGDGDGDLTFSDVIDMTDVSVAVLSYESFFVNGDYQGADETAEVIISNDGGATWSVIGEATPAGTWIENSLSLADYSGDTIRLGFRYNDGDAWNYGFAVDDVSVEIPTANDVRLSVDLPEQRFFPTADATEITFSGSITNLGSEMLTSVDIVLNDGMSSTTETITGLELMYGESADFTHSTSMTISEAIGYSAELTAMNLNGAAMDANMEDNSAAASVYGVSEAPVQQIIVEEGTGTWCGFCPRGAVYMELMAEEYPERFIGIAVHNGQNDPMVVDEYDDGVSSLIPGYPSVLVNRQGSLNPDQLLNVAPDALDDVSPVDPMVTATLDVATKMLSLTSSTAVRTTADDLDLRLSMVLTEDGVTGTGSGYAQVNYYDGGGLGAMASSSIDYTTAGDPVPASVMVYDDVARVLMGTFAGEEGSFPASFTDGQEVAYDKSMAFPENSWDPREMEASVLVVDNATGELLNGGKAPVTIVCPTDNSATVTVQDNTDGGTPDGAISVTDNGLGIAPFTYTWSNGEIGADLTGLFPGNYDLVITDHAGCTQALNVEVQGVTNVADLDGVSRFSVMPNPARELTTLNVQFTEARDVQVGLYDLMGRQLQSFQYGNTTQINQAIDLTQLATGTYLVKVQSDEQVRTERIQVVR